MPVTIKSSWLTACKNPARSLVTTSRKKCTSLVVEKTGIMERIIHWAYDRAVKGLPGVLSAPALADHHLKKTGCPEQAIRQLVTSYTFKSSTVGLLTGLGGPLSAPTEFSSSLFLEIRLVATIAHLYGHDLNDESTRNAVLLCLCGDVSANLHIQLTRNVTLQISQTHLQKIATEALVALNKVIVKKLILRCNKRGALFATKAAPVIGAVVGATFNGYNCRKLGKLAAERLSPNSFRTITSAKPLEALPAAGSLQLAG